MCKRRKTSMRRSTSSLSMLPVHPSPSCSWRRYVWFITMESVSSKRTMAPYWFNKRSWRSRIAFLTDQSSSGHTPCSCSARPCHLEPTPGSIDTVIPGSRENARRSSTKGNRGCSHGRSQGLLLVFCRVSLFYLVWWLQLLAGRRHRKAFFSCFLNSVPFTPCESSNNSFL